MHPIVLRIPLFLGISLAFCGTALSGYPVCSATMPCTEPGTVCFYESGDCFGEGEGFCSFIPQGCAEIYDPVCGCDGQAYSNFCYAWMAGTTVWYPGECIPGQPILNVEFFHDKRMRWEPAPPALGYYIYRKELLSGPPTDAGFCYALTTQTWLAVDDEPDPGIVWLFQVTGAYPDGEGTMGHGTGTGLREPVLSCTETGPQP